MFVILVFPLVLLMPDIIMKLTPKIFWPNPIDKVMHEYKKRASEHQRNVIHAISDKDGVIPLNSVDNSVIENPSKETVIQFNHLEQVFPSKD